MVALAALLVLALGGLGGWWLKATTHHDPKTIGAGYVELTARQKQMSDTVEQLRVAVGEANGAAAVALFTPTGDWVTPVGTYRVADGSLAAALTTKTPLAQTLAHPTVISGNTATFVSKAGSMTSVMVLQFTSSGDVKIVHGTVFAA
jgi:hypothetical protein